MTTIAIAKAAIALNPGRERIWAYREKAALATESRLATWALIFALGVTVLVYLAGLFASFGLGFELRELEAERGAVIGRLEQMEFSYQEKAGLRAISAHPFVSEMQPITAITYLREENAVAFKAEK